MVLDPTGHPGSRVKSFAVSSNGAVGVTVLFDSTISVWDLKTMQVRPTAWQGPHKQTMLLDADRHEWSGRLGVGMHASCLRSRRESTFTGAHVLHIRALCSDVLHWQSL